MMAKRRTSVSGSGADGGSVMAGRCFDPLFEFDAPQLFVDLTLPPKYHTHFPSSSSTTTTNNSNGSLPPHPHDPWFDQVHAAHSKPSYELAQEETAVQQKSHNGEYGGTLNASTIGNSNSSSGTSASNSKHRPSGSSASHQAKGTALNQSAVLEKENRLAGPQRRANVAPALSTLSTSGGAGVGGLSNGATVNAGGGGSNSNNNVQHTRAALSGGSSTSALGSIVSGPPARLRRKPALGGTSGEGLPTGSTAHQEPASVVRMRAPIKTTTAPVAAVTSDPVVRSNDSSTDSFASRKRVLAVGGSAHHGQQRERSIPGMSASKASAALARARFMAPTASSRMAAAAAQKQTQAGTGGDAPRNGKTKNAPRRPAATATSSSGAAGNSDLHDLQALLARHNKKFKATHTYQPPQHSVRDVRMWEKKTQQSYYTLSTEDRVKANSEIAQLVKAKAELNS